MRRLYANPRNSTSVRIEYWFVHVLGITIRISNSERQDKGIKMILHTSQTMIVRLSTKKDFGEVFHEVIMNEKKILTHMRNFIASGMTITEHENFAYHFTLQYTSTDGTVMPKKCFVDAYNELMRFGCTDPELDLEQYDARFDE